MFSLTEIKLTRSYWLAIILALPFLAAFVLVQMLALPYLFKLSISFALGLSCLLYLRKHALLSSKDSILALRVDEDTISVLVRGAENYITVSAELAFVSRHLCLITAAPLTEDLSFRERFLSHFNKYNIMLCPLNTQSAEAYRRLRVFIKLGKHTHDKTKIELI